MRTLSAGLIGVVLAAAGTSAVDLTVHVGPHILSGWQRDVVAAVGGAICAILIWRTLRFEVGL